MKHSSTVITFALLACALTFVRPALCALAGLPRERLRLHARLEGEPARGAPPRRTYLRGHVSADVDAPGEFVVRVSSRQGSARALPHLASP